MGQGSYSQIFSIIIFFITFCHTIFRKFDLQSNIFKNYLLIFSENLREKFLQSSYLTTVSNFLTIFNQKSCEYAPYPVKHLLAK